MEPWTGAQPAFAVKAFYKNGDSFVITQREFWREFGIHCNCSVASAHAIKTWVWNLEATGSTLKKSGSVKTVCQMLASDSPSDTEWWCAEWCELISLASLTTAVFSDVHTVFTLPPFFFSVESVASKFWTQILVAWADGTARLQLILNSLWNSRWAITKLSPFL